MKNLYKEIEELLNVIVESNIKFNTREERFNFIANQYGWDANFGKYYPNNFSPKNSIEIPFKYHPSEKNLLLENKDSYEVRFFSVVKSQKNKLDLIFKQIHQRWMTKFGEEYFSLKWNLLDNTFKNCGWLFKEYVIGIRQSNEFNPKGEISLRFYIYELEKFSLEKQKDKRGIKELMSLFRTIKNIIDVSLELMNNNLILESLNNVNLKKFKEEEEYYYGIDTEKDLYFESVTFEGSILNKKQMRIHLFESNFYSIEGKGQILEMLTDKLNSKFERISDFESSEENIGFYGTWIFRNYLIELKEVNIPYEYVSTVNVFLTKDENR